MTDIARAQALAQDIARGCQQLLGEQLVGVYVHGSLALGAFFLCGRRCVCAVRHSFAGVCRLYASAYKRRKMTPAQQEFSLTKRR